MNDLSFSVFPNREFLRNFFQNVFDAVNFRISSFPSFLFFLSLFSRNAELLRATENEIPGRFLQKNFLSFSVFIPGRAPSQDFPYGS